MPRSGQHRTVSWPAWRTSPVSYRQDSVEAATINNPLYLTTWAGLI